MGHMAKGVYHVEDDVSRTMPSGEWERQKSTVRNWITPDGAPGPTGEGGFAAEAGRYHLYVAWNCPWAHRSLLARVFKTLDALITVSAARPNRTEQGWVYDEAGEFSDPLMGIAALHEVYAADPAPYTGRVTVPVLWDKQRKCMVSNESADIVRMLNTAFEDITPETPDLYPKAAREMIDAWNERIYATVNNGVYRAGFASTQEAYEEAAYEVFEMLDAIDAHLAGQRFLAGDRFTEADLRLFPTLARFDVAYHYAFRCNLRRISDYEHLWPYAREIYQMPGVAETVRFAIYKQGYFSKSEKRNPLGIVPIGPALGRDIDWDEPHGRG
ncbi:MAG: glutathione-dependent reductase [Ahrensia sp.]|nr:glutathione-dependent reductase [Ahrensia sp.]